MSTLAWLELWLEDVERLALMQPAGHARDAVRLAAWAKLMKKVAGECPHDFDIGDGDWCAMCGQGKK